MASLGSLSASDIASIYQAANRSTGSSCEELPRPDGLRPEVELMPHQCAAAQWMLAREAAQDALREGSSHGGAAEVIDVDADVQNGKGNVAPRGKRKLAATTSIATAAAAETTTSKRRTPKSLPASAEAFDEAEGGELTNWDPVGGVLADEPGLGKNLSVLTLLLSGRSKAHKKPSLIVSPTPAIAAQWHSEV